MDRGERQKKKDATDRRQRAIKYSALVREMFSPAGLEPPASVKQSQGVSSINQNVGRGGLRRSNNYESTHSTPQSRFRNQTHQTPIQKVMEREPQTVYKVNRNPIVNNNNNNNRQEVEEEEEEEEEILEDSDEDAKQEEEIEEDDIVEDEPYVEVDIDYWLQQKKLEFQIALNTQNIDDKLQQLDDLLDDL